MVLEEYDVGRFFKSLKYGGILFVGGFVIDAVWGRVDTVTDNSITD